MFFESFAKKPPANMDDLFGHIERYAMLEDDLRATSQQILITNRSTSEGMQSNKKGRGNKKDDKKRTPMAEGEIKRISKGEVP